MKKDLVADLGRSSILWEANFECKSWLIHDKLLCSYLGFSTTELRTLEDIISTLSNTTIHSTVFVLTLHTYETNIKFRVLNQCKCVRIGNWGSKVFIAFLRLKPIRQRKEYEHHCHFHLDFLSAQAQSLYTFDM